MNYGQSGSNEKDLANLSPPNLFHFPFSLHNPMTKSIDKKQRLSKANEIAEKEFCLDPKKNFHHRGEGQDLTQLSGISISLIKAPRYNNRLYVNNRWYVAL